MSQKRKNESNADWWKRKNKKYAEMRAEFKKEIEEKERINSPPPIPYKVVAYDMGEMWNESVTERVDWKDFFSFSLEDAPKCLRSRPDLYRRRMMAEEIPRGVSYLLPLALMTAVDPKTFAAATTWRKPELRMQDKDFVIECRFEHREIQGRHYLAYVQFSIYFGKDFPPMVSEVLLPSIQNMVKPNSAVLFQPQNMRPEDLNVFLDDLMSVFFHEGNLNWEQMVCFNAIMNTVRLQVRIESPWIDYCHDCLRLYHDAQPVNGSQKILCPFCAQFLQ